MNSAFINFEISLRKAEEIWYRFDMRGSVFSLKLSVVDSIRTNTAERLNRSSDPVKKLKHYRSKESDRECNVDDSVKMIGSREECEKEI